MNEHLTMMENNIIKLNFGWNGGYLEVGEIAEIYESKLNMIIANKNRTLGKIRRTSWARQERSKRQHENKF